MLKFCVAMVAALAAMSGATAMENVVMFDRPDAPATWHLGDKAPASAPIKFMIALKQRNVDVLEREYDARTDPSNSKWGQWLEIDQILDIVRPSQEHHDEVMTWLVEHGVTEIVSHGDAIECIATTKVAGRLFDTTFHEYTHDDGKQTVIKTRGKHHVPASIHRLIDFVEGPANFPIPHFGFVSEDIMSDGSKRGLKQFGPSIAYVPDSTDLLYNKGRDESNEQGTQAVIEFQGQSFSPQELQQFAQKVDIPIASTTTVVGPNQAQAPQTEATLDIQWMGATNNGAQNWFWLEPGNDWMYGFTTHFFKTKTVPLINSISYGWSETDQCTIAGGACAMLGVNSQQYVARVNSEFQKIGLRGVTLMAASGDSGANGRTDPSCMDPNLKPGFPGASPYITTVGATQLNNAKTALPSPPPVCNTGQFSCASAGEEVAVSYDTAHFASGGGFSAYSPVPKYQAEVVGAYLNSTTVTFPPSGYFNAKGRGYPDIASIGTGILIYTQGSVQPVGGTSASSPTVAGIMGLLNAHKIAKTGSPLGPLNPFLYQMHKAHPSAFQDIVKGDNKCTEGGCSSTCHGFEATSGWDPVSGLGSSNYKEMLNYLNSIM